ncbi:pyridine nucleotide-disulfide oxidoreductase [Rhodovulum sp. 12E13]|uniref:NAD(P)/FAD-dependent oxidoreductase n=1 Tax=Rhodovulum sp. 12E13 TaxID=2203891 RepID=UPI000E15D892|nr:FAD-dependent oxidoreductase [Rhodovulum sp. 12E13]RDC74040.1 pyridine nucleotide-disulfide oxidoreductase [Rhodovulum sp. 12E13]
MTGIVVVGAGQAGASLVARLRASGEKRPITLIGEEHAPPYQRPPLSKAYLKGEMALERLFLRPEAWYRENGIELRLDTRVDAIDLADRTVIAGGHALAYDELVLTTGAVPRRLPPGIGGDLGGVHVVRGLRDIDRMAPEMATGRRAVVIGGGYIGLEAAAVASALGLDVTVVEAAPRILQRVAAPETSDFIRKVHEDKGVTIREGVGLARLTGEGRVTGAVLDDGTELPADLVIVGIGITPCTALAEAAGIALENGIRVDARGRTSAPHVWAAGDCASLPYRGARIRLESVQNAIDQAETVADNIAGAERDYDPKPWFWSDQYDLKLQIAGLNTGYDRVVVRPGTSHWYYAGDRLLAVDALGDPRAYMVGKRLIEAGRSPDPAAVADPETDLKALLR